jgi:hypothetical protein
LLELATKVISLLLVNFFRALDHGFAQGKITAQNKWKIKITDVESLSPVQARNFQQGKRVVPGA